MTRNRASAKAAGSTFETHTAKYLRAELEEDGIERRTKNGKNDRGDLTGVRTFHGHRVVVECKDYGGQVKVGPWLDEAEIERGNDDAHIGVVVAKRRGVGPATFGDTTVLMTLETFTRLMKDGRVGSIEIKESGNA